MAQKTQRLNRWRRRRLKALLLMIPAGFVGCVILILEMFTWTPLQHSYFYLYGDRFPPDPTPATLLYLDYGKRQVIATDADVVRDPRARLGYRLSEAARRGGGRNLRVVQQNWKKARLLRYLRQNIYNGRSLSELTWPAWSIPPLLWLGAILRMVRGNEKRCPK